MVFTIIGITTVLFVIANYAASHFVGGAAPARPDVFSLVDWPGSPQSLELYRKVFHLSPSQDAMARFKASPNLAPHPTLSFVTQTIDNPFFHVGLEGIRYEPGWDDARVKALMAGPPPPIFALGGSSTLGHGVAGDETWPYFLNRVLSQQAPGQPTTVLNLGAQAYTQQLEIAKLIYLLETGYRPATVIFLDGWNDLFMGGSNMRLVDQVVYHGFATGHGEIAFTPGARIGAPRSLDLFAQSLPLYQLWRQITRPVPGIDAIVVERDAFRDGFDFREADYVYSHWLEFAERHRERFKQLVLAAYRTRLKLLATLADGYGFRLLAFYQPIGLFDETNVFVPPAARSARGYGYLSELDGTVRKAIAERELAMIDISDALDSLKEPRYIDVAHYTPQANRALARVIAQRIAR